MMQQHEVNKALKHAKRVMLRNYDKSEEDRSVHLEFICHALERVGCTRDHIDYIVGDQLHPVMLQLRGCNESYQTGIPFFPLDDSIINTPAYFEWKIEIIDTYLKLHDSDMLDNFKQIKNL